MKNFKEAEKQLFNVLKKEARATALLEKMHDRLLSDLIRFKNGETAKWQSTAKRIKKISAYILNNRKSLI